MLDPGQTGVAFGVTVVAALRCSMKIYTKTGDKGTSSLYSGDRAAKDSQTFQALGDVDEINSTLGVAREYAKSLDSQLSDQVGALTLLHRSHSTRERNTASKRRSLLQEGAPLSAEMHRCNIVYVSSANSVFPTS
jgi:cob(I)alamin adenosyltransferase